MTKNSTAGTKKSNEKSNVGKAIAIGAGVAALAAAGYFFLGPDGRKHRKAASGWMHKMKNEVLSNMKKMKHVSQDAYEKMIDTVAVGYAAAGGKQQVAKLAKELKGYWKSISTNGVKKTANKAAKKAIKKVAKKIVKKAAKKVAKKAVKKAAKKK